MNDNIFYYGDNLPVMRRFIPDESVDLVLFDLPFNKIEKNNIITPARGGTHAEASLRAYQATWNWGKEVDEACSLIQKNSLSQTVTKRVDRFIAVDDRTGDMANVVMQTARLLEAYRVLKPTGSMILLCGPDPDPRIMIILDDLLRPRERISWVRDCTHNDVKQGARNLGNNHYQIHIYAKGDGYTFNPVHVPYSPEQRRKFNRQDPDGRLYTLETLTTPKGGKNTIYELDNPNTPCDALGEFGVPVMNDLPPGSRHYLLPARIEELRARGRIVHLKGSTYRKQYLDETDGVLAQDTWYIPSPGSTERLGYPTQKPVELLKRLIELTTREGDTVLDPCCGGGTTLEAAYLLKRRFIGIDITPRVLDIFKERFARMSDPPVYDVRGWPADLESARLLAEDGHAYQAWAVLATGGHLPTTLDGKAKKGGDGGVDGYLLFQETPEQAPGKLIYSVKAGRNGTRVPDMVRALKGAIGEQGVAGGILVTCEPPTPGMLRAAQKSTDEWKSTYSFGGKDYPRIQILSARDIIDGRLPVHPGRNVTLDKP